MCTMSQAQVSTTGRYSGNMFKKGRFLVFARNDVVKIAPKNKNTCILIFKECPSLWRSENFDDNKEYD